MEFLTSATKTVRVINGTAAGTTAVNGAVVDMSGFEGVRFIVAFGTITDGTPSITAQQGQLLDGSDMADLAGTAVAEAITDDNKLAIVEVYRPRERYVRLVVTRGGVTGAVLDGAIAELYGARVHPVPADSTVAAQEKHAEPAEGTA